MRHTLLASSALGTLLAIGPSAVGAEPPALDLNGRVTDHAPFRAREDNEDEFKAYCQALVAAHQTAASEFARHALHDVTYAHLFEEPDKYRAQVIHLEGRLTRVRRFDAPEFVRQAYDLPYLYEGWLFDPEVYGINSTCIVFTELPSGFEVVENNNRPVSFDGYFFKRYRYRGADGTLREAPLLIGHAPVNRRAGESAAAHPARYYAARRRRRGWTAATRVTTAQGCQAVRTPALSRLRKRFKPWTKTSSIPFRAGAVRRAIGAPWSGYRRLRPPPGRAGGASCRRGR